VEPIKKLLATMRSPRCPARNGNTASAAVLTHDECLEQLLEAFVDIADRDDIHQAAARLTRVQDWIRGEAERAAADPIFADLRLAS
jgi:hypothetical protein